MKDTSKAVTEKSKIEYLPMILSPPHNNVVKFYLDMIVTLFDNLDLIVSLFMLTKLSKAKSK